MQSNSNKNTNSNVVPSEKQNRRRCTKHFGISGGCFKIDCLIIYIYAFERLHTYIADAWMRIYSDHGYEIWMWIFKNKKRLKIHIWLILASYDRLAHFSMSIFEQNRCNISPLFDLVWFRIFVLQLKLNKMRRKINVSVRIQLNCDDMNAECIWSCICSSKKRSFVFVLTYFVNVSWKRLQYYAMW